MYLVVHSEDYEEIWRWHMSIIQRMWSTNKTKNIQSGFVFNASFLAYFGFLETIDIRYPSEPDA